MNAQEHQQKEKAKEASPTEAACPTRVSLYEPTEDRRQAEALRAIVKATAGSGSDFFRGLVAELARSLGVRYAFAGQLLPGAPERVRMVAVWADGVERKAFDYELEGTPCANVVGKKLCLYPDEVQRRFPRDRLLARLGAESYLGIPLFGATGSALGVLCVLDDQPMVNCEPAQSLMTVFASRAAAELERQEALEGLKASEARYRRLYNTMMDAFATVDMSGRFTDHNDLFVQMLGYQSQEIRQLSYRDITPEKWHAVESVILQEQVLARGYSDIYEKEYRRKDGTIFPVELRVVLLKDEAGTPEGMWAIVRDITARKRAEKALRESEGRYRTLHEANPTMIFTLNAQGSILSVNPFAARQLGYTQEELEGQPVLKVVYGEDRPAVSEQLRHCLQAPQQVCHWQFRKIRKDGGLLWVEEIAQTLSGANGERNVLVVCQDVTERRRAELELQKLATVVQNSTDFVGICTPQMEPLFLNEAGRRMVGLDSMEAVRQTRVLDYFWPEDRPFIETQAIPTLEREGRWSGEVRFRHFKTGEPIYTIWNVFVIRDAEGHPVAWATNSPNLTRMKQAELALRESEARFATAFHSNPAMVTITRADNGCFIDVNETFLRVFGFERAEVIGRTALELHICCDPEEKLGILQRLQAGQAVRHYEIRARTKAGAFLDLLIYMEPIELAGEPRVLTTAIDISERKRAEEALRRAHEELELRVRERTAELVAANEHLAELDRLKSQFLATMSHELRTPLNSIIGFTGILRQGFAGPVNAEQKKQLDLAFGSAKHLLSLINDLLDLSRIEAGKVEIERQRFNFAEVVTEVIEILGPQARQKDLHLVTELPSPVIELVSDRKRCVQVLLNLVNNAVKFTQRGEVRVAVGVEPELLRVSVADTGIGIKPEQMGMLFEAFRQLDGSAKRLYEGAGLGLHLCRRLLRLMGGEIQAESEYGKGSCFRFTLPRSLQRGSQPAVWVEEGYHENSNRR